MNRRQTRIAAALALATALLTTPTFGVDARSIIAKSRMADRSVSYRGIKYADIAVGTHTVRAQFRVTHQRPDRTRTDYLSPEEISGIVTVERSGDMWRYAPSTRLWQHTNMSPVPQPISLTLSNYTVVSGGQGQVAGRRAYVIKLIPKKRGNPSESLWVDTRYFLTLKTELRNSAGMVISTSAFREITFEPSGISSSAFAVGAGPSSGGVRGGDLGFAITKPSYVPRGYVLVQTGRVKIGSGYAAHLMYTNGINTISIFERRRGGDSSQKPLGLGRWASVLRFDRGKITYTIIGDVAKSELERIASSLR